MKCKICKRELEINEDGTYQPCEYCLDEETREIDEIFDEIGFGVHPREDEE